MTLPDTIDPENLGDASDEELVEQLIAFGYERLTAVDVVDVLRGRADPILD